MPWSFKDTSRSRRAERDAETLPSAAKNNWDRFHSYIAADGLHPRVAAEKVGDLKYGKFGGTANQYEIRLSGSQRATFTVDESAEEVEVLAIGGHS